ncbi:hypothetical protein UT300007_07930 [Clostridium sp. CTA-7]
MLRLQPIEFFLRAIPEGFLFIFAIYVFSKEMIDKRKYVISSIIYSTAIFLIRMLPINYGVHTILAVLFLLFLTITYNNIDVIKTMSSTIIIFIVQFLSEGINMLIIQFLPDIDQLFKDPVLKTILGLPSLIIASLITYIFYKKINKKDVLKDV